MILEYILIMFKVFQIIYLSFYNVLIRFKVVLLFILDFVTSHLFFIPI